MKVHELIAALQKCDQDAYVAVYYDDGIEGAYDGLIGIGGAFVQDNYPTDYNCPEQWVFSHPEEVTAETQQIIVIG
jgi:hypothetical protein